MPKLLKMTINPCFEKESTAQDAATAGNAGSQGAKAELKADVGINAKTALG